MPDPYVPDSILESAFSTKKTAYKPFTKGCGAPDQPYVYFLVRPQGPHPITGGKYTPSVVQCIDDKLYTTNDDVEPIRWSRSGSGMPTPTDDPFQANLEWCPLPD